MDKSKILVVEDELIIAYDLKKQLERNGFNVLSIAVKADDAFQLARENKPDLVIMDIQLKGKEDGIDAANRIFNEYNVPFIFVTGNVHLLDKRRLQPGLIYETFSKPPVVKLLLEAVRSMLNRSNRLTSI